MVSGEKGVFSETTLFSKETAGILNGVALTEDGTVIVDFNDLSSILDSLSSAEVGILLGELNATVFSFREAQKVYYQNNGSFSDWCHWLAIIEEPETREHWEASQ